jgi:hypothetical protein
LARDLVAIAVLTSARRATRRPFRFARLSFVSAMSGNPSRRFVTTQSMRVGASVCVGGLAMASG